MPIIEQNCLNCQKKFNARSQDIKRGFGKFCCQSCASIYNRALDPKPEPNTICAFCHQDFYMSESKKKNSKSGLRFCCRKHKDIAQQIGGVTGMQLPHYKTGITYYRNKTLNNKPPVCERCSYDKNIAAIIVHHIDRNRENNNINNLEVLCANCHAIEHWSEQ